MLTFKLNFEQTNLSMMHQNNHQETKITIKAFIVQNSNDKQVKSGDSLGNESWVRKKAPKLNTTKMRLQNRCRKMG